MSAGRLYVRPVEGTRGHVLVSMSTERLMQLERAEQAAFERMLRPCPHEAYKLRVARWHGLAEKVRAWRSAWWRMWGKS